MRVPVLVAVMFALSCGKDTESGTTAVGSTTDGPPEWARGKPSIDGRDLVPGFPYNLTVTGLGDGYAVKFLRSDVAPVPGQGECFDAWNTVCTDLVAHEVVADTTAAGGTATYSVTVPDDETPRVVWFQAVATDPTTGAMALSSVLLRHVAVPPSRAALAMRVVDDASGIGQIGCGGNSHTGGAAWVDVNGDYLDDLFVTNSTQKQHRLFLNRGNGTFTDWSDRVVKPDSQLEDAGVQFADIDNDGDADIFVVVDTDRPMNVAVPQEPEGGPNLLYLNNGDGTFTESAAAWGLVDPRGWRNSCATFGDYDRDGRIDVYLCSWAVLSEPLGVQDNFDRLLRNTGSGFVEVPGVDGYGRDALVARFVDLDQDLWPDLYVGNVAEHFELPDEDPRDVLYKNNGGTLTDVTAGQMGDGEDAWAAMGTTIGDIDNDGLWEFYVTDHWDYPPEPRGNPLYRVGADGNLSSNVCVEAGICSGYLTWPANFADFDLDGWVDLWVGTAWSAHNDLVYINQGDGTFLLHAQEEMAGNTSHGGAVADYDLDGDLDVFLFSDTGASHLYQNDLAQARGWIQFRLEGTASNRGAIGAVIRMEAGGLNMMRMVSGGDSAHSQSAATQHFGVGGATTAHPVITWPSGKVQDLGEVATGRFYIVDEDAGIRDEEITQVTAVHDTVAGLFTVTLTSSYHGRSRMTVQPMNKLLLFDAETKQFEITFLADQPIPPEVTIESEMGGEWLVPVVVE